MIRRSGLSLSLSLTFAVALVAVGCSSTPEVKGGAVAKTVTAAAADMDKASAQIASTLTALDALVKNPGPDLKPQYEAFSKHLGELESSAKDLAETTAKMQDNAREYFAGWDEQLAAVRNEDIREDSADRRSEVEAGLKKIQEQYAKVREDFNPLLQDLADIRTALSTDLTMAGLKNVKGPIGDAADDADDVKKGLAELAESFRKLGTKLSQSGPPAPPK